MLLTLHHFSNTLVIRSRRLGLLLKKKGKFMVVCLPWLDMAQGCLMHWVPLWKRNSFPTKPVFLKQEEKTKITGLLQLVVRSTSCRQNVKNKTKNLKTCKSEDFIQERASMYFFFLQALLPWSLCFWPPVFMGGKSGAELQPDTHMSRSGFNRWRVSSSLISPWYGLGILEWAEVCFLQTHTELKGSKFSNCKRGSLKRSLSWMGQCGLMSLQCLWSHHMRKAGHEKVEQQEPMKIQYDRAGVCTIQEKTLLKGMAQSAL